MVVADAGYGDNGLFRTALSARGLSYIVQVKAAASMHPGNAVFGADEYSGRGRPRKPGYQSPPVRAEVLAHSLPTRQYQQVTWRQGSKGTMNSRFAAV